MIYMKRFFRRWIPAYAGMTEKTQSSARTRRSRVEYIILIAIILLGGFLRFYAVNWDSYGAFHPDERNISWAVTRIRFFREMNPKFFAYGGLPVYLYRALGEIVVRVTGNPVWLSDWGHIAVIGRFVSAALSATSIYLIYLVGSLYFSRGTGLVSAAFLAFSPWAIREAHFATTETMLVFFILSLLISAKRKNIVLLGIAWGLAVSAKTTALLFGIIPLIAAPKKIWMIAPVAALTFFAFSPYTVLDFAGFSRSMTYETGVTLGRFTVPYTLQFYKTPPYVYQIGTMLWQAGPVAIIGIIGLILLIRKKHVTFWAFPLLYFAWAGSWYAKFARYNVPILPFLTVAAAWLLVEIFKKIPKKRSYRIMCLSVYWIIGLFTMAWGLANFSVYLRPQTKIEATDWIYKTIPAGSVIYTEHWNDGLPLDLPGAPVYRRELLTVYDEPDDAAKKDYLAAKLAAGDYMLFSTRRIWATMPRLTKKYPVTSRFYRQLLDGRLGYTEVARFSSYPIINDDAAEESIQVFDHPTVRIFRNTGRFTKEKILSLMGS